MAVTEFKPGDRVVVVQDERTVLTDEIHRALVGMLGTVTLDQSGKCQWAWTTAPPAGETGERVLVLFDGRRMPWAVDTSRVALAAQGTSS